jgi:hypothetical protein
MDEGLTLVVKQDEHIGKLHKYQEKINMDQYKRSAIFFSKDKILRGLSNLSLKSSFGHQLGVCRHVDKWVT